MCTKVRCARQGCQGSSIKGLSNGPTVLGRPLPAVPWSTGSSAPSPSCSGTVAVLAGLVALRSAQTHDPSWGPAAPF